MCSGNGRSNLFFSQSHDFRFEVDSFKNLAELLVLSVSSLVVLPVCRTLHQLPVPQHHLLHHTLAVPCVVCPHAGDTLLLHHEGGLCGGGEISQMVQTLREECERKFSKTCRESQGDG
uniref:Uncharacterized protein n=1 Tax=Cacopsylla melanoneura TaxID=428564 RepID=A0A8D8PVK2_9HEMI